MTYTQVIASMDFVLHKIYILKKDNFSDRNTVNTYVTVMVGGMQCTSIIVVSINESISPNVESDGKKRRVT